MTRHEIQILRAVGMAQTAIAAKTGVSVRSVRRIEDEPGVRSSDTAGLIRARGVGRPSLAAPWAPTVERWLQEDRTVPSGEIIRRLREDHGYRGGKSALYELIRRLRPVPVAPLVRFEGVPGEFSQHDFGMVSVRYVTGVVERVRFFASRLKWSRFVDVTLVPDEREEALIRGLLHALEAFRGVPLVTVWDNPKTVVLARKGEQIVWNPVFGQVDDSGGRARLPQHGALAWQLPRNPVLELVWSYYRRRWITSGCRVVPRQNPNRVFAGETATGPDRG